MKLSKTNYSMVMMALITILVMTQSCKKESSDEKTSIDDVKQEAQELIQSFENYTVEQRDEALGKAQATLAKMDKHIDDIEKNINTNWDNMNKTAREKARADLKAVQKKRTRLAEKYGSLKTSSKDAWDQLKKGFADSYKDFYSSWEKAVQEFDSNN